MEQETIVAISTPAGRGGIGVVRLSGPQAREIVAPLVRLRHPLVAGHARFAELLDTSGGAKSTADPSRTTNKSPRAGEAEQDTDPRVLDEAVVTLFAAPNSYTGEDVVEIAAHGSPVLLEVLVRQCCAGGARLAEPGEFTQRAFLAGRIGLTQAEAVNDLIGSVTLEQARVAARQMSGALAKTVAPVKAELVDLIAEMEAGIDFAEDDIEVASDADILARLAPVASGLAELASSFDYGKLVHSGLNLAIVGRPNVGKSSLFNRLLEQDRAIVTEAPGTTRDLVSEAAAIEGIPVKFVDTAGIRTGQDRAETLGVERSFQAMADADLRLVVFDLSAPLAPEDLELAARARSQGRTLLVGNKCDLERRAETSEDFVAVSALTGAGIPALRRRIAEAIAPAGIPPETGFITSLRHAGLLKEALAALEKGRAAAVARLPHEMLLLDLYAALQALDAITGATTADDILNRIFSTFCIGK